MNRCGKDLFGYCTKTTTSKLRKDGIPLYDRDGDYKYQGMDTGSCRKDPKTCGYYVVFMESVKPLLPVTGNN